MNSNSYKFVIALNKKMEPGVVMNAAAHLALSLVAQATPEQKEAMKFISYSDADGKEHPSISGLSLIILRGKEGDIRKLRKAAIENNMLYADFIDTMTGDTYVEQLERTKQTSDENLAYYGVAVFGKKDEIDPLTKKFSLWK